jgi:ribonuclease Z
MHNALDQITLRCGPLTLMGFSISGLATYVQVPELDVCFDMGECPLSAVPVRHVLLTHAHGDHARCLLRHRALRGMLGIPGDPVYFLPATITDAFVAVARADAAFEGVADADFIAPPLVPLSATSPLQPLPHRKNTFVRAFDVDHRGVPSLGYTLIERRKKLRAEYADRPGAEIGALRKQGIDVSFDVDIPLITFIGDCVATTLRVEDHIWRSQVLVIEATYVDPADRSMAAAKGHTHIDELGEILAERGPSVLPDHIVLKHFSMKVTHAEVVQAIERAIPAFARDRVRVLLHGLEAGVS